MNVPDAADVAIIGGGPAGLAAAIVCAQAGVRAVVIAPLGRPRDRIGESLSPSANAILRQLGVWQAFLSDAHLPCHANRSCWDSDRLETYDFLRNPLGHAWHIDRRVFEDRLAARAHDLGVGFVDSVASGVTGGPGAWSLPLRSGRTLDARFLIDASGRASWLARRLGIARTEDDRQIALVAFLGAGRAPMPDTASLIEAVPGGWWYSAALPNGQLATALFSDADLLDRALVRTPDGWQALLERTVHTAARVQEHGFTPPTAPRIVPAGSGSLAQMAGPGWAAAGDAALSFDPLSSHGLTVALASGRDAAAAAQGWLSGDPAAVARYHADLVQSCDAYRDLRARYYAGQRRWPSARYWRRRQPSARADAAAFAAAAPAT